MSELGLVSNQEEYQKKLRNFVLDETASRLKEYAEKKDELIAQVVHSIDDLQKSINLSANRLTELYSLHFPEMVDEINNVTTLARIISTSPRRGDITRNKLQDVEIPSAKIDRLLSHKDNSLGGDLDTVDLIPMQEYAGSLIDAHHRKLALERWIDTQMERTAPNLTAVAGANVGARLIAAFGSLRELAMSHSAKVQVIGAESALYSALRGKGTPPKHGIIFQIPEIGNAPYWLRGKLARKFAAKIVIAARLDEFDGELLGPKYREDIRAYEQEMRESHPEPPQEEK
jgi:nucleolar protein 56